MAATPQAPQATSSPSSLIFVPYWYEVVSGTIASLATGTQTLILDQDADFELHYVIGSSSHDDESDFRPNFFSVQITDKSNSRIWSSARVPQSHIGVNEAGYRFVRPVTLARRTNLFFDFLNLFAGDNIATITLMGAKIYNLRG